MNANDRGESTEREHTLGENTKRDHTHEHRLKSIMDVYREMREENDNIY